jgi:hypothetical protein
MGGHQKDQVIRRLKLSASSTDFGMGRRKFYKNS